MASAENEFTGLMAQVLYKVILAKLAKDLSENGIPSEITINGSNESKDKILDHFKSILGIEGVISKGSKRPDISALKKSKTPKKGSPKHSYLEPEEYLKRIETDPGNVLCSHVPVRGQNKNKVCCKRATDKYTVNNLDARCKDCLNSDGKPKAGNGKTVFGDLKPSDAHANEIPDFNTTETEEPVAAALSGNVEGATSPVPLVVPGEEEEKDEKEVKCGGGEAPTSDNDEEEVKCGGGEAPPSDNDEEERDDLEDFLSSIPVANSPKK